MHAVKNSIQSGVLLVLIGLCSPFVADAATLNVVPSNASMRSGETISVAVTVSSTDQAMNAVDGVLKFPSDLLQVAVVSKAGSVIGLWVQEPSFSNSLGTVNFEGIALNPGYTGANGTVLTVTFRARKEGSAQLSIENASILANDGNGTSILSGVSGGMVTIGAPLPPTKPEIESVKKTHIKSTETIPSLEPQVVMPAPVPITPPPSEQKVFVERSFDFMTFFTGWGDIQSIVFAVLIIVFAILNILLFLQYLRLRKREGGSLDHAQIVAHRSFLILRDDIDTFAQELEEEAKKRELTTMEKKFIQEIRGDLTSAEKAIVKELRENEKQT